MSASKACQRGSGLSVVLFFATAATQEKGSAPVAARPSELRNRNTIGARDWNVRRFIFTGPPDTGEDREGDEEKCGNGKHAMIG
jgi:hypothetical protein